MTTAARQPVLVVTGGHRVDMAEFTAMFDALGAQEGWEWQHATQPEAQQLLRPEHRDRWRAIVLHDIAGLRLRRGQDPEVAVPDHDTKAALAALLDAGVGVVVTHHSLASWPAWDGWAHAIGGRFLYAPGTLDGERWPSSGYRIGSHPVTVLASEHPVCAGVHDFVADDERYLCPVFEHEVVPLLGGPRNDGADFRSAHEEVLEGRVVHCEAHPPVPSLLGWVKVAGRSPMVYLQLGHGPATFAHPSYRTLLSNAIRWVSTDDAHAWARAHPSPVDVGE
jgi:uncharacterized protein